MPEFDPIKSLNRGGIAQHLVAIRRYLGLSQAKMAEKAEMTLRAWQKLEAAEAFPSALTLQRLLLMGFDVNSILLENDPVPEKMLRQETGKVVPLPPDPDLLASILSAIHDARGDVGPAEMARLAAGPYDDYRMATADKGERLAMVKLLTLQLRKQ